MRFSKVSKSPVMKDLLSNPKIAKTLDTKKEQRQFYKALKETAGSGRVTNKVFAKTLGRLKQGTNDSISRTEVGVIKREKMGMSAKQYGRYINSSSAVKGKKTRQVEVAPTASMALPASSTSEKIKKAEVEASVRVGLPMMPESFFKSDKIAEEVLEKNDEAVRPGGIYDLIRERNQMSDEDKK